MGTLVTLKGRRNRNLEAVKRWVTFWDSIFPASAGSTFNLESFDEKPESSPPVPDTDRVWDYLEDPSNRETAQLLREPFAKLRREHPPLYVVVGVVGGWVRTLQNEEIDHGTLRRWEAGETFQDRVRADLFNRALAKLEEYLEDAHPGVRIRVNVRRHDTPADTPRQHNDRRRTWAKEDSFRLIGAEVERVMIEEDCNITAAKGLVSQRDNNSLGTPCSFWRVHEAWLFYQREQEGEKSA